MAPTTDMSTSRSTTPKPQGLASTAETRVAHGSRHLAQTIGIKALTAASSWRTEGQSGCRRPPESRANL